MGWLRVVDGLLGLRLLSLGLLSLGLLVGDWR